MGGIFGKKKHESRVTEQDKAVLQLKQQRDQLRQYQRRIETLLEKDKQTAKQLLANGKKDKAKLLLRKKKYQETLLEKTDKTLENIERMTHDLEFAQIEVQVVQGLKAGNEALTKLHKMFTVEDVQRIMDDTHDAVEYQKEIDALLAGGLSAEDEEDVLKELNDIIRETEPTELPAVPTDDLADEKLPDVPTHKVPAAAKDKKQEKVLVAAT